MPLPAPDLDTRTFQDIVDDVKRQIALRCPEWTEHNVSDPGVTVLELFAYLFESTLFRLNQVPERNYIKFLDLIGVSLDMPRPAQVDLRYELTRFIEDNDDGTKNEQTLPALTTVASTSRTDTEDPIEFMLDVDLKLVRPHLKRVYSIPRMVDQSEDNDMLGSFPREFDLSAKAPSKDYSEEDALRRGAIKEPKDRPAAWTIFGEQSGSPQEQDCIVFGFDGEVPRNFVELEVWQQFSGTGLAPDYPSQIWEYWKGDGWAYLPIESDTTQGFDYDGKVRFICPPDMERRAVKSERLYWVRARYTVADLEPKLVQRIDPDSGVRRSVTIKPQPYKRSPHLLAIKARTIGGQAPASNCILVENEILGRSDGTPGQMFKLLNAPVLALSSEEVIKIGVVGNDPFDFSEWSEWTCVEDFALSTAADRHFTLDPIQGVISFGPAVIEPEGGPAAQKGAVPPKGHTVAITRYRLGGGIRGNVAENRIVQNKNNLAYIDKVYNPLPATGGREREDLEHAKLRAKEILKTRNRAVTPEDYELLAMKASSAVGRAKCIQPTEYQAISSDPLMPPPGSVKVVVVPALSPGLIDPTPEELRLTNRVRQDVFRYLDERRLLTANLVVSEPTYVFVSVHLQVLADPKLDFEVVKRDLMQSLNTFVHPCFGWHDGSGWPFGKGITLADVYARIALLPGLIIPVDARLFVSRIRNPNEFTLDTEKLARPQDMVLKPYETLCSRQHVVEILPMSALNLETGEVRF